MKMVPTEFEIYDPDMQQSIGIVNMLDEGGAKIVTDSVHNLCSWRNFSLLVEEALKQMELEGDE